MTDVTLAQVALFLAAAVVAAPLAKLLRIGNVLGYLLVGVLIGPVRARLRLLRLRGELGPALRRVRRGAAAVPDRPGAAPQAPVGHARGHLRPGRRAGGHHRAWCWRPSPWRFGLAWPAALFAGLALSLSSTAFALQVLEEKGELALRHGRLAFAVLLFQDLAAIPLIALTPLFAVGGARRGAADGAHRRPLQGHRRHPGWWWWSAAIVLDGLIRIIARTRVKEAMTACALLTVVGVTLVMEQAGLSASLGAFIAGVLLADSDYRHEIEADIAPFEGLLLGLFFTAIGMSLNLGLIVEQPLPGAGHRRRPAGGQERRAVPARPPGRAGGGAVAAAWRSPSRRAASSPSCCSPPASPRACWSKPVADLLSVAVTLSMAATPLLLLIDEMLAPQGGGGARLRRACPRTTATSSSPASAASARSSPASCVAKRIPFTALDSDPEQVDFVRKFGARIFYGDASRPEILEAAQTGKARAFVLAIDNVEASLRTRADGARSTIRTCRSTPARATAGTPTS